MAKYLTIWRMNPDAPWPQDPATLMKLVEMLFAVTENMIKAGRILEHGYSLDGGSGFNVKTGDPKDALRDASLVSPWIIPETHEVVSIEIAKEVVMATLKAQAEAMAAMKR